MVFVKVLVFIACVGLAIIILKFTEPIVRMFGKMSWAEQYLGMGGTYTAWKLMAVVIIVGSLIYLTSGAW